MILQDFLNEKNDKFRNEVLNSSCYALPSKLELARSERAKNIFECKKQLIESTEHYIKSIDSVNTLK